MQTQGRDYNLFLQSLEEQTERGFLFHYVDSCIYITDDQFNLLGIWDTKEGARRKSSSVAKGVA